MNYNSFSVPYGYRVVLDFVCFWDDENSKSQRWGLFCFCNQQITVVNWDSTGRVIIQTHGRGFQTFGRAFQTFGRGFSFLLSPQNPGRVFRKVRQRVSKARLSVSKGRPYVLKQMLGGVFWSRGTLRIFDNLVC